MVIVLVFTSEKSIDSILVCPVLNMLLKDVADEKSHPLKFKVFKVSEPVNIEKYVILDTSHPLKSKFSIFADVNILSILIRLSVFQLLKSKVVHNESINIDPIFVTLLTSICPILLILFISAEINIELIFVTFEVFNFPRSKFVKLVDINIPLIFVVLIELILSISKLVTAVKL